MCPASVLISACLPFIYYLHSTSAAVLPVEFSAPDNNVTQNASHFNTTVDSLNQLFDCRGMHVSNMSSTYIIIIVGLSSGLLGGLTSIMFFLCFLRRSKKIKTLKLLAGDESGRVLKESFHTIDSFQACDYTNHSQDDIGESSVVVSGTPSDLNYSYCTGEFYCYSHLNLNFENCHATSRGDGEYYNVSNSDVRSETDAGEADAENSNVYNVITIESEPENIYEVPVSRSRRESFDDCYAILYDVQSLDGNYNITNCVGKPLTNVRSKKRSNMVSVFYSEANLHNITGRETFHYSEPVVFEGFKRQVFNVGGSCSNINYVNTDSAAGSCVEV